MIFSNLTLEKGKLDIYVFLNQNKICLLKKFSKSLYFPIVWFNLTKRVKISKHRALKKPPIFERKLIA